MDHYRIGIIGTKGPNRKYLSTDATGEGVEIVTRKDALHWPKKVAGILARSINVEFARAGREERFQIEKS